MDWYAFYMGGFIASLLMVGMAILWNSSFKASFIIAMVVFSVIWPIGWPMTILLGFTKINKVK